MGKPHVSPSRCYVAMCNNINFDGHYFVQFELPETRELYDENYKPVAEPLENNAEVAIWYFLNFLNGVACVEKAIALEDFSSVRHHNMDHAEYQKVKQLAKEYKKIHGENALRRALSDWRDGSLKDEDVLRQIARM